MRTKIKTKSCFPFPSREENLTFLAENETKKNGKVLFTKPIIDEELQKYTAKVREFTAH